MFVICLSGLPPDKSGQLLAPVYMALQPERQTAYVIANIPGGLLHHLLTLIINYFMTVLFFSESVTSQLPLFQEFGALCCPDFPLHFSMQRQTGLLKVQR